MKPIQHQNRGCLVRFGIWFFFWVWALGFGVFFSGCAVGPDYKRPSVVAPETFRFGTNPTTNSLGELPWWEVFKDPTLQELIRVALTNNYDLKQAVARVEQARNVAVLARAPLLPQVGYSGGVG